MYFRVFLNNDDDDEEKEKDSNRKWRGGRGRDSKKKPWGLQYETPSINNTY